MPGHVKYVNFVKESRIRKKTSHRRQNATYFGYYSNLEHIKSEDKNMIATDLDFFKT